MNTRFIVSHDGVRIAYAVTGAGQPLMLVHGAGKTRMDWHTLGYVERLSKHSGARQPAEANPAD